MDQALIRAYLSTVYELPSPHGPVRASLDGDATTDPALLPELLRGDPRTIMLRYADFVYDALKDDPAFFARFSFFVYAANPEVAELLASGDDAVVEDFGPVLEQYLALIGRRVRRPFTAAQMLISINSLFQGLCLRYRTSPELVEHPVGPDGVTMYAHGLESIVMHFSEAIPDDAVSGEGAPT